MKPSRCTWPSHSSLGHGINQIFIAGNSLQISACHVYQSVWQMITPSPEQQPYLGWWACPGFLDELVLELCGQESRVRLSTPGCHRVTDWGEILSESIPPSSFSSPPITWTFFTNHGLLHTWYLLRAPREYPCKFFMACVNFYRFNAKNWQFTV